MTYYKLINTRTKTDHSTLGYWWDLMIYIKQHELEGILQRDINVTHEWCWTGYLIVVNDLGLKVSYDEVKKSLKKVNVVKREYYDSRLHPETEYGTVVDKSRYYRRSTPYKYRIDPVPFVGGNQWWGHYKKSTLNKKYWADLQEYNVKAPFIDRWDETHRQPNRSWKSNTKKRKQWS